MYWRSTTLYRTDAELQQIGYVLHGERAQSGTATGHWHTDGIFYHMNRLNCRARSRRCRALCLDLNFFQIHTLLLFLASRDGDMGFVHDGAE